MLEALAKHDYPSVVEAVVRAPGVTQEILGQIHQRCMDAEPAFRFADVLAALSELTNTGSIQSQPPVDDSQEIGSEELIGSLEPEQLELLFNALAVAGIEDVVSRDQSEVWTLLGEDEPDDYDYNTDSHSEIIERATGTLAQDLDEAYQISYESFDSKIQENRGYWKFWQRLSGEEFGRDIDSFSEALDRVLEDIS